MNKRSVIRQWLGIGLVSAALLLLAAGFLWDRGYENTESAAVGLGQRVEERIGLLDRQLEEAFAQDPDGWLHLPHLPEDMVIYRYREDTLQSWAHQFPLMNDDIRSRTVVQRLGDQRGHLASPLREVGSNLSFANYGPRWYLVKSVDREGTRLIAGLELVNELRAGSMNGINRRLRTNDRYTILPISAGIGVPVEVGGVPLFKITTERITEQHSRYSYLFWLSVLLFLWGSVMLLYSRPRWLRAGIVAAVQTAILTLLYFYGRRLGADTPIFSPLLYADGIVLYSLGAVILIHLWITALVVDLYLMRWTMLRRLQGLSRWKMLSWALLLVLWMAAIVAYLHYSFRSIIFNSSIMLELYKVELLNGYTALVYATFLVLSVSLLLLFQLLSPLARRLLGLRYDAFSRTGRVVFALVTAAYFVITSSYLGYVKECSRMEMWANRLSMDRDISLEIQLRSVEQAVAADPVIAGLSALENGYDLIQGRLVSTYMSRISQDYDINVVIMQPTPLMDALFNTRIRSAQRIADNSHFFYSLGSNGRARYTGFYTYYVPDYGSASILVLVESKHNREDRGYLSLLGISEPGRVMIPPRYSYAKYISGRLGIYKGDYPYPTVVNEAMAAAGEQGGILSLDGYSHFVEPVSEDEVVIISRKKTDALDYLIEGILFALLSFLLVSLLLNRRRKAEAGGRHYYQNRINLVMYVSLTVTLVVMAVFSVWFVYKRNNVDMQNIMVSRINTLQTMLQARLRQVPSEREILSQEVKGSVEATGNNLKCDITLFSPSGRLLLSTTPEVYDRMILGHLLGEEPYYDIVYAHKRFCIHREQMGRRHYYALYAPVFNGEGRMIAIAGSPYTDQSTDFESEAVIHIVSILTIFVLLLLVARVATTEMISRLFRPLREMSRKMTVSDVTHLELIDYQQDDELTGLVQAYNRMVQDLSDSTRRLAQMERDKAWTDMARRVAHDIKNPLTPIKLKLQMLIRMKQSGNPAWQDRFDEVAATVLEHVDVLAASADQFSTFAKLYDQAPERIDLDALVSQEVFLFDAREDLSIEYIGLEGAWVEGPKPQLTRVLVNLITNAVQAVEAARPEGGGRILVSVRNSVRDGYYDMVVEDNGPGVSEDIQDRIFQPDFTTKSSGSGLGLAICSKIVEHCGGSIAYSRSFALGGACFTVQYPKSK